MKTGSAFRTVRAICLSLSLLLLPGTLFSCAATEEPPAPAADTTALTAETSAPPASPSVPADGQTDTGIALAELPERYAAAGIPAENQTLIVYDVNGGSLGSVFDYSQSVSDSATHKIKVTRADGFFFQTVTDSCYLCPHAMGDKGYLTRPGYVLYGYNTAPDGSGEYFGCGWNVPVTKGQMTLLYAMWAEETAETDFTLSGTEITAYRGTDTRVVVPAAVNGKTVTALGNGAFAGTGVTEVILPKTVTAIRPGAFSGCGDLRTVRMYDTVTELPEEAFENCPAFSTLIVNNAQNIKYIGSQKEGSYHMKFQRLLLNRQKRKLVLISGSNAVYGIDSRAVEEKLGGRYAVINYGTNYYVPSVIYLDVFAQFAIPGDAVCILPEEVPQQWGDAVTTTGYAQFFPAVEGCMELISLLDMREYRNMLPFIAKYDAARASGKNSYESVFSEAVDEYGDFSYLRTEPKTGKWSNTELQDWFGPDFRSRYFTDVNVDRLNRSFDRCVGAGASVLISFSVVDGRYVSGKGAAVLEDYENAVRSAFVDGRPGRALISHVGDYVFDHSLFYNSMHHLLTAGAQQRTDLLGRDIAAALPKG